MSGGGSSGHVTLSVDESRAQHRVAGTYASGSAISSIAKSGSVSCQPTGVTQMMGGSAGNLGTGSASFIAPVGS